MKRYFQGHIDHSGNGEIFGWARDRDNETSRLSVRISLSNGWQTTTIANILRHDLADKQIGDGCYGFKVKVPCLVSDEDQISVTATIEGTDFQLNNSQRKLDPEYPIFLIAGDIVNNCNLRCPFCVTDYQLTRGTKIMDRQTFEKSLALLPYVPNGMFWLSCMHEPTMHSELASYIELIPLKQRKKISFTTNLCKKLDDHLLKTIAFSGINNVRISIDSFDPNTFSKLRKGGKLDVFLNNLERFSEFIATSPTPPKIHYITMAFNDNLDEIEALIEKCKSILEPARHEIRFMFYVPHAAEWGEQNILSNEKWGQLKRKIQNSALHENVNFYDPEADAQHKFASKPGLDDYKAPEAVFGGASTKDNYSRIDPREKGKNLADVPLRLRMRWDGLLAMENVEEDHFCQNISDVDVNFFLNLRNHFRRVPEDWHKI